MLCNLLKHLDRLCLRIKRVCVRKYEHKNANLFLFFQQVMVSELGADWRETHFESFDDRPFAAASIGQVHAGILKRDAKTQVAVKIQYPGVAKGIDSDIKNLLGILSVAKILPEGERKSRQFPLPGDRSKREHFYSLY